jgi:hypothetical protein
MNKNDMKYRTKIHVIITLAPHLACATDKTQENPESG